MNVDKYVKEVEAVYFDGHSNVQEIANWCGGMVVELVDNDGIIRKDRYLIDIPAPGGYVSAGEDFYIFKDGPSFMALDRMTFLSNFEEKYE